MSKINKLIVIASVFYFSISAIAETKVLSVSSPSIKNQTIEVENYSQDIPILSAVNVVTTQADRSKTVTVITREETKGEHFTNINDALFSGTPGVVTSRRSETGFGGPNSGFLIRGLQGPHVPVFVDGIPIQVNNHFHARVDRYSSDMIDNMEITRGPSVLKHGASAVAGAVDIYTRKPSKGYSGFIEGNYGTYDTKEVFGDFGYGWDDGSFLFSASDRLTEGPPVEGSPFAAEAHDLTNLNFKINQAINNEWSVGFRISNAKEVPEHFPFAADVSYRRFGQNETDKVVHLDRKSKNSNTLIAIHDDILDNYNGNYTNGALNTGTTLSTRKETETGILGKHTWSRGNGDSTTVGLHRVKYTDDRFEANNKKSKGSHTSAYVQSSQGFEYGIRVDGGVRVTNGSDFDTNISPEIGIIAKVNPVLTLRARTGKAFRVPRIGETDANFQSTIEPEDFTHAEVGLNRRFASSEFDVAVWWMGGDNLIVRTGNIGGGNTNSIYDNSGKFNNRGVEALFTYKINSNVSSYLAATFMSLETENSSPQTFFDAGVEYRKDALRANLKIRDAKRNANPDLSDDDYTVLDGRVQYDLVKNTTIFANVDNISDTSYRTYYDRFSTDARNVGRLTTIGIRYSF